MTRPMVLRWADLQPEDRDRLLRRSQQNIDDAVEVVRPIVEDIAARGSDALCHWTKELDAKDVAAIVADDLIASPRDFEEANAAIDAFDARQPDGQSLRGAIQAGIANVVRYHEAQSRAVDWEIDIAPGTRAGERITPIRSVGLYVPRGKGSFPSVLYMLAVPAYIAGVPSVAICTPPDRAGRADAACLVTAQLVAAHFDREPTVFKVGGAQAVAALAYGVAPLPHASKILGPGNEYVAAAKRLLAGVMDAGLPAGPSESLIICDEHADPVIAAHELSVEAEHGPRSAAVLLTHDETLAQRVAQELERIVSALPEPQRTFCATVFAGYGGIVVTESLSESLALATEYAAEHVRIMTNTAEKDMAEITDAGEILLGECSSIPLGNFAIGLNAILPTGRFARTFSAVGVDSFLKRTSFAEVTPQGLETLAPVAMTLAQYEGFPAHYRAVDAISQKWATSHEAG